MSIHFNSKLIALKKQAQCAPQKAKQVKGKEAAQRAQISLTPDGLYEVSAQYTHTEAIVKGCGFQTSDVVRALAQDNLQCAKEHLDLNIDDQMKVDPEGPGLNFDLEEEEMV